MKAIRVLVPFLSLAVLTVFAALPWGLPTEDRFFLPLLPAIAIHYWAMRRPEAMPEWSVFIAGLLLDIFTHGPLGYWPLVYLASYTLGILGREAAVKGLLIRSGVFLVSLVAVAVLCWAVASVYFLEFADWRPYAQGLGLAVVASLVIVPVLHILGAPARARDGAALTRGG